MSDGAETNDAKRLARLFLRELEAHKVHILEHKDGDEFVLEVRGVPVTVSLSDLAYDFDRDADPLLVKRFVAALVEPSAPLPAWRNARPRLFLSAASALEHDDERIRVPVTTLLCMEVVHAGKDERVLTPITKAQLGDWQVDRAEVMRAARENLALLLDDTPLEVHKIGPIAVGTFATRSLLKPALLFGPNLKEKVATKLGWPVLGLMPCRESVFLLRQDTFAVDTKETQRFLGFVIQEFLESRHNLTPELLQIADDGITPLATLGQT
jgi:hypothetical protein